MGRRKSGLEDIAGGLGILGLCGVLLAVHLAPGWIIFPGIFFGGLPAIKGIKRLISEREQRRLDDRDQAEEQATRIQRAILKVASRNRGVATPALVSLEANIPLEQADTSLQAMAAKGYAELNIRENGTLEYRFPDLVG